MAQIYITPEKLTEISDRFTQHHHNIESMIKSINADREELFPPFTGAHPEEERLRNVIELLQRSSETLSSLSALLDHSAKSITIPDELLIDNPFKC